MRPLWRHFQPCRLTRRHLFRLFHGCIFTLSPQSFSTLCFRTGDKTGNNLAGVLTRHRWPNDATGGRFSRKGEAPRQVSSKGRENGLSSVLAFKLFVSCMHIYIYTHDQWHIRPKKMEYAKATGPRPVARV